MLYSLLRIPATLVLRVYFRRIYIDGMHNIPDDQGTLLVSNHPNAFLEACLMACFQPHKLYFLVRGDVFTHPLAIQFLRGTHQIPIYRFRDGFSNLKRNAKSFRECYEVLKEGEKLLIFGEASTKFTRHLRPLQRGAARIIQGVTKRFPDRSYAVVPTAIYFSHPEQLRSTVRIRFGPPMDVSDWLPLGNDNEALDAVTADIEQELKDQIVHIPPDTWEKWMEDWLIVLQNEMDDFTPGHLEQVDTDPNHYINTKIIQFLHASDNKQAEIKKLVEQYSEMQDRENITDRAVQIGTSDLSNSLFELIMGWPFYVIGKYGNIIPLMATERLSHRLAPKREFIASMNLGFLLLFYPIYFVILIIFGMLIFSYWGLVLLVVPLLGAYALRYEDIKAVVEANSAWSALSAETRADFRMLRDRILNFNEIA